MKPVTDPQLLAQLNGNITVSDGRRGMSTSEAKSAEAIGPSTAQARALLNEVANLELISRRVPTGRFSAAVNMQAGKLPSGWQPENVADFQKMDSIGQSIVMPAAALYAGKPLTGTQMDSAKEAERWAKVTPQATQEPGALSFNVNRLARLAQEQIARDTFARKWRAKFGSMNSTAPDGRTAEQVFAEAMASGRLGQVVNTPFTSRIDKAVERRRAVPGGAPAAPKVLRYNPATGELE